MYLIYFVLKRKRTMVSSLSCQLGYKRGLLHLLILLSLCPIIGKIIVFLRWNDKLSTIKKIAFYWQITRLHFVISLQPILTLLSMECYAAYRNLSKHHRLITFHISIRPSIKCQQRIAETTKNEAIYRIDILLLFT